VPTFEFYFSDDKQKVFYRYSNCVKGFNLPLTLKDGDTKVRIIPSGEWKNLVVKENQAGLFDKQAIEKMYYVTVTPSVNPK
jgi:hypothetical protein